MIQYLAMIDAWVGVKDPQLPTACQNNASRRVPSRLVNWNCV